MTASNSFRDSMAKQGFAFFHQHASSVSTLEALSILGEVETVEGFATVQALKPRPVTEAPPNTYSGNFGVNEFPLHSDLAHWVVPPRYIALRCIIGTDEVETRIFDGQKLIDHFGKEVLRRVLVSPRRPFRSGKQLLRVLDSVAGPDEAILRWDGLYLLPATQASAALHAELQAYLKNVVPDDIALRTTGDTLVIDNWRMLHGRSKTSEMASSRHIDRAYMRKLI